MDAFGDGDSVFMGPNDAVEEENVNNEGMPYGFHGGAPPLPMDGFYGNPMDEMHSPDVYGFGGSQLPLGDGGEGYGKAPFSGASDNEGIFTAAPNGGPLLPDPSQMREEGAAFREWRRQNTIYLDEKEKKEKELRMQIVSEAEEYKRKFDEKRMQTCETNKAQNREREKLYHAQQDKFHKEAEAGQHFWKAVAEIIPREVPNIEKRRGRKEDDKKPSVLVVQGPKPGKPTDMSRMRQLLMKLKTNSPPHMMPKKDNPSKEPGKDAKDEKTSPEVAKESKDGKNNTAAQVEESTAAGVKPVSPVKGVPEETPTMPNPDEVSANEDKERLEKESSVVA